MANLVAMLRLPGNLKSTQWQILAGPILIGHTVDTYIQTGQFHGVIVFSAILFSIV